MMAALTHLSALAGECVDTPVWSLSDADLVAGLDAVHRAEQALAAVKLHLIREAQGRDLPAAHGASGAAVWLRQRLRISIHTAKRLVELARYADRRPALDAALASGALNVEQAHVIATAVSDLPAEAGAEAVDKAEAMLIDHAGEFEPVLLRKLGARILAHVAPEVADKAEAEALARQERRAYEGRAFTLTPTGHGRVRVTGWLEAEAAAIVNAALDPLCTPRRSGVEDARTPAQRRADALVEICQLALHTGQLPEHGGDRPQVVVTVPFDLLRRELGAGTLDTGQTLSPEQVRRMACDAQLIPAVLGGQGQVLDLGTARRLFTGPVRRALILRDGGCAFPGCDRHARWCQAHHLTGWADGGPTSVDNGVLVCHFHHRVIHQGDWSVRLGHDRRPEFLPPAYLDPERRPRRNIYHRRL
jgi:hypothetical protein